METQAIPNILNVSCNNKPIQMRPQNFKVGLIDLMSVIDRYNLVFVEIGCYRGESTEIFLESGKIKKMYCIDPWLNFYDINDHASLSNMDSVMNDFDHRIVNKWPCVEKHRGTIESFIISNLNTPLDIDIIYIDANHTYDSCKNDIMKSLYYIKPKYAICGHDYAPCFGVFNAVNDIFTKPDMTFIDSSWLKFTDKCFI